MINILKDITVYVNFKQKALKKSFLLLKKKNEQHGEILNALLGLWNFSLGKLKQY